MSRQFRLADDCAMQIETYPEATESNAIRIKNILVPTDFSPASGKALDYALQLSKAFGSTITLLHVVEPAATPGFPDVPPASEEAEFFDSETELRRVATSLTGAKRRIKYKIVRGAAGHEIIEAAKDSDIDLIVIATHGLTSWKHFCIGSTAELVARAACCPVLVVREKEHEFI